MLFNSLIYNYILLFYITINFLLWFSFLIGTILQYGFFFTKEFKDSAYSNRDILEIGSSILSRVGSPKTKLSLELFKFYSLLIVILSSF